MNQKILSQPYGRLKMIAAFGSIYIIWGSTYLAIRFGIETMPPFMLAAVRFLIAGAGLYGVLRWRGVPPPTKEEFKTGFIIGIFLFLGGNGGVVWAEQYVPSGLTALLIATTSLWMILLDWLWKKNGRPSLQTSIGIVLGMLGIFLLIDPVDLVSGGVDLVGAMAILAACFSWSIGSIYAQSARLPESVFMVSALEIIGGGVSLAVLSIVSGEWIGFDVQAVSANSIFALLYLIVFGSIIALSAYAWILRVAPPDKASTYSFVNPAVAVFLGWLIADEVIDLRIIVATAVIIVGVILVISSKGKKK